MSLGKIASTSKIKAAIQNLITVYRSYPLNPHGCFPLPLADVIVYFSKAKMFAHNLINTKVSSNDFVLRTPGQLSLFNSLSSSLQHGGFLFPGKHQIISVWALPFEPGKNVLLTACPSQFCTILPFKLLLELSGTVCPILQETEIEAPESTTNWVVFLLWQMRNRVSGQEILLLVYDYLLTCFIFLHWFIGDNCVFSFKPLIKP